MKLQLQTCLLVLVAVCFCGIACGQSVMPVPSFSALISSPDYSSSTYAYVDVAGYFSSGDSGGGGAYQGPSCAMTKAGTTTEESTTISIPDTTGIIPGMSVYAEVTSSNPLPPGDTVTAVNSTSITVAQAATGNASPTLVLGGNGGTVFMVYEPTTTMPVCFYRQNYTGNVLQFGAKCDLVETAVDGSISQNSTTFTSSLVSFTSNDIGKTIELSFGKGGGAPFTTTIANTGTLPNQVILSTPSPHDYPGDTLQATDINMLPSPDGPDDPGTGWTPGDVACQGTSAPCSSTAATATVTKVGLVGITPTSGGTEYAVNDILYGAGNVAGQKEPAQIQVNSITSPTGGPTGTIASYTLIYNGLWAGADPATITWTGGHGSGFTTSSPVFGVMAATLTNHGSYSPPLPTGALAMSATTCASGSCASWSANLTFSGPSWSYGTDDTVALQNIENYAETQTPFGTSMRGLAGAITVPQAHMCYSQGLVIQRPVSWSGAGPKQSRLVQILGSPGNSVNGSTPAFVTLAMQYPTGDDYQQSGYGPPQPTFENLALWGSDPGTTAYVNSNSTVTTNSSAGIVIANPVSNQGKTVPIYLSNVEVQGFPNYLLSAQYWGGDIRGYQVNLINAGGTQSVSGLLTNAGSQTVTFPGTTSTTGLFPGMSVSAALSSGGEPNPIPAYDTITAVSSNTVTLDSPATVTYGSGNGWKFTFTSGDCLDLEHVANPSHFFGLVTAKCNTGINIVKGGQYEFHGWVGFSNNINAMVTGAQEQLGNTITFYGAQFTETQYEQLYLDQQNETVICYMCKFKDSNRSGGSPDTDSDSDIVIGPDAGSGASGNFYPVLQLSSPVFSAETTDDNILFDANSAGYYCACRVTLDGLSVNSENHGAGLPSIYPSALAAQVISGYLYAPLQFATGNGSAVAENAPANAAFGMTFGQPSRLFSYLASSTGKNFTATPPGGVHGNWNVSFADDVWDIERSGPSGTFTDTWDSAANIVSAINNGGSYVAAGQRYSVVICNSGGGTETLASPGTAVTLVPAIMTVAAGTCAHFGLLITAAGTSPAITIVQDQS